MDDISAYDYTLPPERIADEPLAERDRARLLHVPRGGADSTTVEETSFEDFQVRDLPDLLQPGDCIILNDTRVVPAKLLGHRTETGGKWEGLFLGQQADGTWELLGQTRGKIRPGESVTLRVGQPNRADDDSPRYRLTLRERTDRGGWFAKPEDDRSAFEVLEQFGTVPLPPYIEREQTRPDDRMRYQTVYADEPGAVAAPTAGLHFTPELFDRLEARGVAVGRVTLHVGIGTFRPMTTNNLNEHHMHAEWCRVPEETSRLISRTKADGGRVIAIGTTTVRTLESAVRHSGNEGPLRFVWQGETDLFIRPPFEFRAIDGLLTNFHLPKSTLLVLVCTFGGYERLLKAYREAIDRQYRFYSFGDAMLIV